MEVIIDFKSEEKEGIVAVGTYLIDAAKRLGIKVDCDCNDEEVEEKTFSCAMKVSKGKTLLSKPTKTEMEQLSSQARKAGERLSCQTKIEKSGEVTIMSVKKKEAEEEKKVEEETQQEEYRKQFEELPLEKKISSLMELEAIALGETFSFVLNSPYAAVGKVMDVLAEFGLKMEKEDEEAKRPDEHAEKKEDSEDKKAAEGKSSTKEETKKKTEAKSSKRRTTRKRTNRRKTTKKKKDDDEGNE